MEEQPLPGGRVTEGVVRVGQTVRRPMDERSPFVLELLRSLAGAGFDAAPRFLGIDEEGRATFSFVEGAALPGTTLLTDAQISSAAELLRRFHDVAATLPLRGSAETIVHGDPGPWNIVWIDERAVALIDFDEARPGQRLDDLGYLAWKGLRLVPHGPPLAEQRRRLALLAQAYGTAVDVVLLDAIEAAAARLHEKGKRERWPRSALDQVEAERAWIAEAGPALV